MAAAADAMAVPPMPVKWTDLISDENMSKKFNRQAAKAQSFLLTAPASKCAGSSLRRCDQPEPKFSQKPFLMPGALPGFR
jgi:hypothetical protein